MLFERFEKISDVKGSDIALIIRGKILFSYMSGLPDGYKNLIIFNRMIWEGYDH